LYREPLPSSCTPKIWCSGALLLLLGLLAEGIAAFGYCIIQDGVTQCTSNYRTLTAGFTESKWSAGDRIVVLSGNDQVPLKQSLSSPPQPWWQFDTAINCPGRSCGTIAAYGSPEYLSGSSEGLGGWQLSFVDSKLKLSSGSTIAETPVLDVTAATQMSVSVQADFSTSEILFRVVDVSVSGGGKCLVGSSDGSVDADACTYTTAGTMDFSDFDRDNSNYELNIGGLANSTLIDTAFTGTIKTALQTVQVGAEYIMIFCFLFVGTLCYCVLWIAGRWIVASESAELDDETKIGEVEQKEFVAHQLANAPAAADPEWNNKLLDWKQCQKLYKQVLEADDGLRNLRLYGLRAFFFMLVVLDMFVVLNMAAPGGKGFYNQSTSFLDAFLKAWNFSGGGVGWVFLFSSLLETVLFVVACLCVVWPAGQVSAASQLPRICQHHKERTDRNLCGQNAIAGSRKVSSLLEETNSTCLLIACHNSALNDGMRTDLTRTLEAALANFPPEAIFVCDNGRGMHPSDDTEGLCERICKENFPEEDRRINYVFIPEGNKTHALYWVSEWWIPYLQQKDQIPNFEYLVMIDDDVPLPPGFDFHAGMMNNDSMLACCGYAITAVTPTDPETGKSEYNFLVGMQDIEYRLSGFFKLFQAELGGSAFYAHGAVSLWRRSLLGKEILYKHDTEFHGEDLYMGLLLHRQSQGNKIHFSASNVVETFAPDHFKLLFKQRTKSWDLATHRKFPSILRELVCRWENQFLLLKVFHFGEVVAVVQDWLRLYLFILLLLTNPVCLAGIAAFFFALAYLQLLLFRCVVLRRRPDLKDKLGPLALFAFPIYKTISTFMFRQFALMENAFYYSTNFKRHTVEKRLTWSRDAELRDKAHQLVGADATELMMQTDNFPPRPTTVRPNWFHVWQPSEEDQLRPSRMLRQSQRLGCIALVPNKVMERIHVLTEGPSAQLLATHAENQGRLAPLLLAHVTLMQLGVECLHSCFKPETIARSSVAMLRTEIYNEIVSRVKIAPFDQSVPMVKTDMRKYQQQVDALVKLWQDTIQESLSQSIPKGDARYGRYIFMTQEIAQMEDVPNHPWEKELVQGTTFALNCILEEIAKMRIPDAHDIFRLAKNKIHDCIRELETGRLMR
jgi:hypothetical protein